MFIINNFLHRIIRNKYRLIYFFSLMKKSNKKNQDLRKKTKD